MNIYFYYHVFGLFETASIFKQNNFKYKSIFNINSEILKFDDDKEIPRIIRNVLKTLKDDL